MVCGWSCILSGLVVILFFRVMLFVVGCVWRLKIVRKGKSFSLSNAHFFVSMGEGWYTFKHGVKNLKIFSGM